MTNTLGRRINFIIEKRNKSYIWYGGVSITNKKLILRQEHLWSGQLRWSAERCGV